MAFPLSLLMLLAGAISAFLTLIISRFSRNATFICFIGAAGPIIAAQSAVTLIAQILTQGGQFTFAPFFFADALSALLLGIIAMVSVLVMLYSIPYVLREFHQGHLSISQIGLLYFWSGLLLTTMYFTVLCSSLGVMWVFIEATTLVSVPLVGLTGSKASLEATWKYLMLATVGISFALLGTLILYASAVSQLGEGSNTLDWIFLLKHASDLNPGLVKLAFIFILVGYGTKAGLAPLHTWLPDAHSQAPTPISALLSGALLNCAFYGILRLFLIARITIGVEYPSILLIVFGLFSIGFVIPFIIRQYDLKRLLAYSSVEHMGIIALAIGIGGKLGMYAAALHMVTHALAKSTMFCVTGEVVDRTRTRKIARIAGLSQAAPIVSTLLFISALAIVGAPPMNVFISEWLTVMAMIVQQQYVIAGIFLMLLAILFGAMLARITPMVWGNQPPMLGPSDLSGIYSIVTITADPTTPMLQMQDIPNTNNMNTLSTHIDPPIHAAIIAPTSEKTHHFAILNGMAIGILIPACTALLLLGLWIPQWLSFWIQSASEVLK